MKTRRNRKGGMKYKDVFLYAVRENGMEYVEKDKEIVLAAVQQNGIALQRSSSGSV